MTPLLATLGHDWPRRHLSHRHAPVLPSFRFRRPWEGYREPQVGGSPPARLKSISGAGPSHAYVQVTRFQKN